MSYSEYSLEEPLTMCVESHTDSDKAAVSIQVIKFGLISIWVRLGGVSPKIPVYDLRIDPVHRP